MYLFYDAFSIDCGSVGVWVCYNLTPVFYFYFYLIKLKEPKVFLLVTEVNVRVSVTCGHRRNDLY